MACPLNACSLKKHINDFRQHLHDNPSYDIFGVAETRFGPLINQSVVNIPGYSLARQDRNQRGGGVALYFKDYLKFTLLASSNTMLPSKPHVPEYIMGFIQGRTLNPIFVCVVYKPPVYNLRLYSSDFRHKIVMGDFNFNVLSVNEGKFLRNLAKELALEIVNHGPTHFKTLPGTWIDAILIDSNETILASENQPASFKNHHNLIEITLDLTPPTLPCDSFTYRDFNKIDASELNYALAGCDWMPFDSTLSDLKALLRCLTNNVSEVISTLAPAKTVNPRKRQPPWVNSDITFLKKERDAALRRFKRTRASRFLDEFLRLRKEVSELTEQERTRYISDKLTDTLGNKRNFWRDLCNLGLLPSATSELHGFSLDELNRHFAGVSCSSTENPLDAVNVIESAPDEGFSLNPITLSDVILAVSHFSTQARGEDDVPQSVIAKALPTIGPFLVTIFNTSIVSGVFPEDWRRARLIPLKKKFAPSSAIDFRPIALLSFLSKTLEKLIHDQIVEFIARVGILDPLQAGFRKHHSTATALMKFTEDIRTGFDRKLITIALLFDFSKAFDTISPTILLPS